jgi:hypothetical protein
MIRKHFKGCEKGVDKLLKKWIKSAEINVDFCKNSTIWGVDKIVDNCGQLLIIGEKYF